jgi:predicted ATP-grasp superfamily ATP-dependent carboligase
VRLFIYEFVNAGGLGPDAPLSLRREGWAMLCAVVQDLLQQQGSGNAVTTMLDGRQPGNGIPESPHIESSREEPSVFRDYAAAADFTLVIAPEFDNILLVRSRWVLEAGGRLLGSLPEGVFLTSDKLALARHWQRREVRTPATATAGPTPPTSFGPPWVCKPRHGAGSQATFFVNNTSTWHAVFADARAQWRGDLLAQEFVPGIAASVAFLIGPRQQIALLPATQNLSTDGRFEYRGGQVPLPEPLRDRAVRLARSAIAGISGLQGYVGVDLVLGANHDGSDDYAIEINPRLTTSFIGVRRLCEQNLVEAWSRIVCGQPVTLAWKQATVEFAADGSVRATARQEY